MMDDHRLAPDIGVDVNRDALASALDALAEGLGRGEPVTPLPGCPALDALGTMFGLSPFERGVVLLCAGVELDTRVAAACAGLAGSADPAAPTLSLALAVLPEPHWSVIGVESPLRRWRLVHVDRHAAPSLTTSPLRIDERVLGFLIGLHQPAAQLQGLVAFLPGGSGVVPSHRALVDRVVRAWSREGVAAPAVVLEGRDRAGKRVVAAAACEAVRMGAAEMPADAIPAAPAERTELARVWERESALSNAALYLDAHDLDAAARTATLRFLDALAVPVLVGVDEPLRDLRREALPMTVERPTGVEQRALWRMHLGPAAASLNGSVDLLASHFDLTDDTIRASVASAAGMGGSPDELAAGLWEAGRVQSRARLDDLAERIESAATWDDLALPDETMAPLRELVGQVRGRATVYERWGFGRAGARGLGISALFAGPSGTGKTLAAEVVANELRLDLYRIDLSGVVSKYIGETERNLRRVFDAAEEGGAVLFFDEADALFGKRSEVKDSHDRYANIQVNYLLQRMESYRGVAVLATNAKGALDGAFLRRIRFTVSFPFPDEAQRAEIWRRVFPASAPLVGVDPDRLARLSLTGGNIRSVAVNAAFLAAAEGEAITPAHLARAVRTEFVKLERPMPDDEIRRLLS